MTHESLLMSVKQIFIESSTGLSRKFYRACTVNPKKADKIKNANRHRVGIFE